MTSGNTMIATSTTRLWTVEEYYRMVETGILAPDERVELIEGEVISMASKKPPHVLVSELSSEYLRELLADAAYIRRQDPVHLNDLSEPEPDIAVVFPPLRRYFDHHPSPEEIFLIVEVADATLQFDLKRKAAAYAKSEIQDYWVVDVNKNQVYIFREPVAGTYTKMEVMSDRDTIRLLAFPDIEVVFQEFFP
jgi:Uma2 family endonuclease